MDYLQPIDHLAPGFADGYDELPLWSAPFGRMLLDLVPLRPGMTILDVGAGTGFLSIELAWRCGAGSTVIAVDPWGAALDRLAGKVAALGMANIRTLTGDAATIELPDESVDLIVSNLGINNFDDPPAVLRTLHRVARPGASLVMTSNLVGHMAEFYEVYREVLLELGHTDRIPALDAHIQHRATTDSLTRLLTNAGFEVVETTEQSFRERHLDGSALLRHHFVRLGFVPGWKSVARPDAVGPTFAKLEERLNQRAARDGDLSLTIPAACLRAVRTASDRDAGETGFRS